MVNHTVSVKLTYTPPAEIDGEPGDVRELSLQQLGEALAAVADLTEQTVTQLRAEGVGREGEVWMVCDEARDALMLAGGIRQATSALNRLQQAV
jgi:hypothetical protein